MSQRPRVVRTARQGLRVRRQYRTAAGVLFWTVEVPEPVFRGALRTGVLERRERSFAAGLVRQEKQRRAESLLRAGWKPEAVASATGVSPRTVQRYRRNLK